MEPAVLAELPAAVLGQEALTGKVVGEGAGRISPSQSESTDPVWLLGSPSRKAANCGNQEGD